MLLLGDKKSLAREIALFGIINEWDRNVWWTLIIKPFYKISKQSQEALDKYKFMRGIMDKPIG